MNERGNNFGKGAFGHFAEEDLGMASKHVKSCSTTLAVCQNTPPSRPKKMFQTADAHADKDWNIPMKSTATLGTSWQFLIKINIHYHLT